MYRILWAEDDVDFFEKFYKQITSTFLEARGLRQETIHAVDGNAVFRHLTTSGPFDLLVVDIDMPNWNGIQTARDIAERFIGLPIIVVSAKVHVPEFHKQLDTMVAEGILKGYFSSDPTEEWCEAIAGVLESGPVTILHFSDLHFGRFFGLHRATVGIDELICSQFDSLIQSPRVDLLVVSGDFCSEGFTGEFQQAIEFLIKITTRFSISRERVILVPGNHDIYRKEEPERRFNKFAEFITEFYGSSPSILARYTNLFNPATSRLSTSNVEADSLYSFSIFDDLKLVVIGLNSVTANEEAWERGEIRGSQLLRIETELAKLKPPRADFFRMAIFHHHLFEVPTLYSANSGDRVVESQGLILRHLIRHRIRLILHGHSHYGAGYRYQPYFFSENKQSVDSIFVFSTGTLGGAHKASAQYSYQCNILRLLREDRYITRGVVTPLRLMDDSLQWQGLAPIEIDF